MASDKEILELKAERTKLKVQVTLSAKRLRGTLERNSDKSCIDAFVVDLERAISDFDLCHEEFAKAISSNEEFEDHGIVNGMDLQQYADDVRRVYDEANKQFKDYKCRQDSVGDTSVTRQVKCQIDRLYQSCTELDLLLIDSSSEIEVSCGINDVERLTDKLLECFSNLDCVVGTQTRASLADLIEDCVTCSDKLKRKASVYLMEIKARKSCTLADTLDTAGAKHSSLPAVHKILIQTILMMLKCSPFQ